MTGQTGQVGITALKMSA